MNFPIWETWGLSGGALIALVTVLHVFVAQFAVGGGFFLVMVEKQAHQANSPILFDWVHSHARFFLLLTMVFGGLSGVGVWLVLALVSPAGISLLVREFLYAWAAEWAFFVGEIIALILYVSSFVRCQYKAMPAKAHLNLGRFYALFAFLSLVTVNSILTVMLTPGDWAQSRSFWDGMLNPGALPALVFRFGLSLMLAGVFGLFTATRIPHQTERQIAVRVCARWVCLPFILMLAGALWSYTILPPALQDTITRNTRDMRPFVRAFLDTAPVLFLAGMFLFVRLPQKAYPWLVAVVVSLALVLAGSFEWMRETSRRPWLVQGVLYSNGITPQAGQQMNTKGALAVSGWGLARVAQAAGSQGLDNPSIDLTVLSQESRAAAGKFFFAQQCSTCHGMGKPMLDILPLVKGRGQVGISAALAAQGKVSVYMPPFFGLPEEREILAEWLAGQAQ